MRDFGSCKRRQRAPDRLLHLAGLRSHRITHPAQLATQAVDLVEEPEDHRQCLFIDGKFPADLKDQFDPGNVDVVKDPGLAARLGQNPAVFDPPGEITALQPTQPMQQLFECDHAAGIPCLALKACCGAHFSRKAASSGSLLWPISTFSVTI